MELDGDTDIEMLYVLVEAEFGMQNIILFVKHQKLVSGKIARNVQNNDAIHVLQDHEVADYLERVRQIAVQENLELAIEYNSESFGRITMLYLKCSLDGVPGCAFVDTGAQMTILSAEYVKKLGLEHLIDTRFQGVAQGVGTSKILGKIHSYTIRFDNEELPKEDPNRTLFLQCSFTITELKDMDLLIGLDLLKRYHGCINLEKNVLQFGLFQTKFLNESELPNHAKQEQQSAVQVEPNVQQDQSVQTLINFGMSRQQAVKALEVCKGNVELAAAMLFQN